MKSLIIGAVISTSLSFNSYACEEMKTTQAIVEYVCDYSLVSNTQCNIWKEDMRQMNYNSQIIVDSFISWNRELEIEQNLLAEHSVDN